MVSQDKVLNFQSSCRKKNNKWVVAMDKWQKMTDMEVNKGKLNWVRDLTRVCLHVDFFRNFGYA